MWNDETNEFQMSSYVPVTFEKKGGSYVVSVTLPNNTTDTALSLTFPSNEFVIDSVVDNQNFKGVKDDGYVVWKALTPMSEITGTNRIDFADGGFVDFNYSFE